jgi:hypothetical protein
VRHSSVNLFVSEIDEGVFKDKALQTLYMGGNAVMDANIKIPKNFCKNCTNLKGVVWNGGMQSGNDIGESAFEGCSALIAFDFNACTKVGKRAFYGCPLYRDILSNGNTVSLADKGTVAKGPRKGQPKLVDWFFVMTTSPYLRNLIEIGEEAFAKTNLRFISTNNIYNITLGEGAFRESPELISIQIPKINGNKLPNWLIYNCPKFTTLNISQTSINTIGYAALAECAIFSTFVAPTSTNIISVEEAAFLRTSIASFNFANLTYLGPRTFQGTKITSANLPGTIGVVRWDTFRDNKSLTIVTINSGITTIESAAFHNIGITSVIVPSSVTSIAQYGFSYNPLTSVILNANINTIESNTFEGCTSLQSITLPSTLTTIRAYAFAYTDLRTLTIPAAVTSLGEGCFTGIRNLTTVNMGSCNSLGTLPVKIFWGCWALSSITLPPNLTIIEIMAFEDCVSLVNITTPNSLTTIKANAFKNCNKLTSFAIKNGTTLIDNETFNNCTSLTTVSLPTSITRVGHAAFHNCQNLLLDLNLPNLQYIDNWAFAYNKTLRFESGPNLKGIGVGAFIGSSLRTGTIKSNLDYMGTRCFESCSLLDHVFWSGNAPVADNTQGADFPWFDLYRFTPNINQYVYADGANWNNKNGTYGGKPFIVLNEPDLDPNYGPYNDNVPDGRSVTFSVRTYDQTDLNTIGLSRFYNYQWYRNGNPVGTNSRDLTFTMTSGTTGSYFCIVSNILGSATSKTGILNIITSPTIVSNPTSQNSKHLQAATFSVVAKNATTYKWQTGRNNIYADYPGATQASITIDPLLYDVHNQLYFRPIVSNPAGSATGQPALLGVRLEPVGSPFIKTYPQSFRVFEGESVTFYADAVNPSYPTLTNYGNIRYQWRLGEQIVQGANSTTLSINNATPLQAGNYSIDAINNYGTGSSFGIGGVLSIITAPPEDGMPYIVEDPASLTVRENQDVTFKVSAFDTTSYQWFKNDLNNPISGATGNTFSIYQVKRSLNEGNYFCRVTGTGGNSLGPKLDYSATAFLNILKPPVITTQPQSRTGVSGQLSTTFSVSLEDTTDVIYQWYKNRNVINNATGSSYIVNNLNSSKAGEYTVRAYNFDGYTNSNIAELTVIDPPIIWTHPETEVYASGDYIGLFVEAEGLSLSYQWQKSSSLTGTYVNINNATGSFYEIESAVPNDKGFYKVRVTNPCTGVLSNAGEIKIYTTPVILTQPNNTTVTFGGNAILSTVVDGSDVIYQWQKNDINIYDGTGSSLILTDVDFNDQDNYKVIATNPAGSVTSNYAMLTVVDTETITKEPISYYETPVLLTDSLSNLGSYIAAQNLSIEYQAKIESARILSSNQFDEYRVSGPLETKISMNFYAESQYGATNKLLNIITGDVYSSIQIGGRVFDKCYLDSVSAEIKPMSPIIISANFSCYEMPVNKQFFAQNTIYDTIPNSIAYGHNVVITNENGISDKIKDSIKYTINCSRTAIYSMGERKAKNIILDQIEKELDIKSIDINKFIEYDGSEATINIALFDNYNNNILSKNIIFSNSKIINQSLSIQELGTLNANIKLKEVVL